MSQSIPLRTTLGIEQNHIVIHGPRHLRVNVMIENLAAKKRIRWLAQRPVQRDSVTRFDLAGGRLHNVWGQQV